MLKASPALLEKLASLGIFSNEDLLLHLPLRYEDETSLLTISEAPLHTPVLLELEIIEVSVQFRPRRQLVVVASDASDQIVLRFLNFYGSQTKTFENAQDLKQKIRVFGVIKEGFFGDEMVHPKCRVVSDNEALPEELTPVYPTTAGISQHWWRKKIASLLKEHPLAELLPEQLLKKYRLAGFQRSLLFLHAPPPDADEAALSEKTHPAWRRVKFDELLAQQLSLQKAYLARRAVGAPPLLATGALSSPLLSALPFTLTAAQKRVVAEISQDLAKPFPMQRLLQGDVGSGKTIVAALAACQAIEAGFQAALMAPTEILAEQHFAKLSTWLLPLGVKMVWLSGSLKTRAKKEAKAAAKDAHLVIGTHALIQEGVDFSHLGLVIIDEQHRFGVKERLSLRKKGKNPHQLMMSATPIPRTLAMSYYADLDVSVIDELPPGRQAIQTRLFAAAKRDTLIAKLRTFLATGSQAYWVCPLIEESETLELETAIDTHALLSDALSGFAIGLVHGRLKPEEKAAVMRDFVSGKLALLVATTVIEVGVDIPNASLMVIEHAERFGLSQLHQLRGRVGRGAQQSTCMLLYHMPLSALARERLKVMYENTDGFEIARLDLELRGPGEFIGARQSGVPLLRYANLETDLDLIEIAKTEAKHLLTTAPEIANEHLARWLGKRQELLKA